MPEFATDSGQLHYEVLGPTDRSAGAPTLTLLHNFLSTGRAAWGPMLDDLTRYYRVLLPDLPGHGRSGGYPAHFDHTAMARQVAELMAAENAATDHVAGCSSGGMIAQILVRNGWVQPTSLILVSTTYSVNPQTTGNPATLQPEAFQFGRRWMEATARLHDPYRGEGYFFDVLLPGFRAITPQTGIDLALSTLAEWEMPVCLVQGEEDEFFPPFIVEQMAQALPRAETHIVPGQSHALIFRQSWKVRDILLDFLERQVRSGDAIR